MSPCSIGIHGVRSVRNFLNFDHFPKARTKQKLKLAAVGKKFEILPLSITSSEKMENIRNLEIRIRTSRH